jgi:hypothetical protein
VIAASLARRRRKIRRRNTITWMRAENPNYQPADPLDSRDGNAWGSVAHVSQIINLSQFIN